MIKINNLPLSYFNPPMTSSNLAESPNEFEDWVAKAELKYAEFCVAMCMHFGFSPTQMELFFAEAESLIDTGETKSTSELEQLFLFVEDKKHQICH